MHAQAVLLLHPTFQGLQRHPRIEGSSAASQDSGMLCSFSGNTEKKLILAPVLQVLWVVCFFFFFSQWQWAVALVQLFIPRQGLGRAFPGHKSILISFWMGEVEPYTEISQGRHQPPPSKPQPCPILLPLKYWLTRCRILQGKKCCLVGA